MKKFFVLGMLLLLTIVTRAQNIINFDFDITRPLAVLSLKADASGAHHLKDGCTWSLEVKDFDTAGNIVAFDINNPAGENVIHKTWDNAQVVNMTLDDGSEAYVVAHGQYTYLMVFEIPGADGKKTWYARLYTEKRE